MPDPDDSDDLDAFDGMNAHVASLAPSGMDVDSAAQPCASEPLHVRILLKDRGFHIVSRPRYEFEVDGELRAGHADNGIVDEPVSAGAPGARLTVWIDGEAAPPTVWDLRFAPLDPIGLEEGVGVRMFNLGLIEHLGDVPAAGKPDERLALQREFERQATGTVDPATRAMVQSLYSSDTSLRRDEPVWEPPAGLGDYEDKLARLIASFGGPDGQD